MTSRLRAFSEPAGIALEREARSFNLVLFDLDGTLIATAGELADALNATLADLGLPQVAQATVEGWIGHGTRELLVQALAAAGGGPPEAVRRSAQLDQAVPSFDRHYRSRCGTRSHLYPHVREALHALRGRGVRLAVVTNKDGAYTHALLDRHGLTALVDLVVCGDTLPSKKPAPQGILHCLAHFSVSAERALFVGDSSLDVAAARGAGVRVWALTGGYNMGQPIEACKPDHVIASVGVFTDAGV